MNANYNLYMKAIECKLFGNIDYIYTASHMHSAEPKSRATASGQTAFSCSTCWAACILCHHEVEGRGIQWAGKLSIYNYNLVYCQQFTIYEWLN